MKQKFNTNNFINELYKIIDQRYKSKKINSYSKKLLKKGPKFIAQKVGEEATELIIDYLQGSKKRTTEEAADIFFHVLILLYSKKIKINDVVKTLEKRRKQDVWW